MKFERDNVVRIFKQPKDVPSPVEGLVGFVSDAHPTRTDLIEVTALKENGDIVGGGYIPSNCLELVDDPVWLNAKSEYDRKLGELEKQILSLTARYEEKVLELSKKYRLTPETIKKIDAELREIKP